MDHADRLWQWGEEAANPGQREVSVFSTVTKGTGREPAGLSGAGTGILSVSTQLESRTAEAGSLVRGMLFACG